MDPELLAKWPDVPACFEWLSLDRRGQWRLKGELVTHAGLITFLNLNYAVDERGRWFVQNGPQRVFVDLASTPFIYRYRNDLDDPFASHTGHPAGRIEEIFIDSEGNVLISAELGFGQLDDRDLMSMLDACRDERGQPVDESAFAALMEGASSPVFWGQLRLAPLATVDIEKQGNFVRCPRP